MKQPYSKRKSVDGDGVLRRPGYWIDEYAKNVRKRLKEIKSKVKA